MCCQKSELIHINLKINLDEMYLNTCTTQYRDQCEIISTEESCKHATYRFCHEMCRIFDFIQFFMLHCGEYP